MLQEYPVTALIQKIETLLKSEKPDRFFSLETLLQGLSVVYAALAKIRTATYNLKLLPRRKLPCVVISIGNISVGGTGKTPMTLYLAKLIASLGYRVVVLSRGYKGKVKKTGGIVSNGTTLLMSPAQAGDEPYMMACELKGVPVVVGRNRYEAGCRAITAFSPDVILLDDGFQHLKLARDIDLVLVDHQRPFGNRHLLPRGPLRESISALKRADIIIETRCDVSKKPGAELEKAMHRLRLKTRVFQSVHTPYVARILSGKHPSPPIPPPPAPPYPLSRLKGKRVLAFSGLADNRNFHRTLTEIGCILSGVKEYPDHHWYDGSDFAAIRQAADETQAELILTTQKDAARIPDGIQWPLDLIVMGITPSFDGQTDAIKNYINGRLLIGKSGVLPHACA